MLDCRADSCDLMCEEQAPPIHPHKRAARSYTLRVKLYWIWLSRRAGHERSRVWRTNSYTGRNIHSWIARFSCYGKRLSPNAIPLPHISLQTTSIWHESKGHLTPACKQSTPWGIQCNLGHIWCTWQGKLLFRAYLQLHLRTAVTCTQHPPPWQPNGSRGENQSAHMHEGWIQDNTYNCTGQDRVSAILT